MIVAIAGKCGARQLYIINHSPNSTGFCVTVQRYFWRMAVMHRWVVSQHFTVCVYNLIAAVKFYIGVLA